MTKATRNAIVGMAITLGTVGIPRADAADRGLRTTDAPVVMRVRTHTPALATLIQRATERSATFRGLVETINASDGIVYVNEGACSHGRACLVAVRAAGPNRLLYVKVDTRKADWDLMGSIGHELRHAIEVLGEPGVTSTDTMYFFYLREGRTGGTTRAFETDAALEAGAAVRSEVRRPVLVARTE